VQGVLTDRAGDQVDHETDVAVIPVPPGWMQYHGHVRVIFSRFNRDIFSPSEGYLIKRFGAASFSVELDSDAEYAVLVGMLDNPWLP